MLVELRKIKLSKSVINQMQYIGVPKNPNIEVLGWVYMDKKKWVIVKSIGEFYRAEFIKEISKEIKGVQFPAKGGGYEFPHLTNIRLETFNGGFISFSAEREESKNVEFYNHLVSFKRKTEIAGQVYY